MQGRLQELGGGPWSPVKETEGQGVAAGDEVGAAGRGLITKGSGGHGRNDRKVCFFFFF